jgi:hypothetical protein
LLAWFLLLRVPVGGVRIAGAGIIVSTLFVFAISVHEFENYSLSDDLIRVAVEPRHALQGNRSTLREGTHDGSVWNTRSVFATLVVE